MKMELVVRRCQWRQCAHHHAVWLRVASRRRSRPDGKRVLFASNKNNCDGRKFELFLINLDGTGLEQVTDFGGFTAFPEISPDGKRLVFCSDRHAKERYEFNIFVADWR